jgi:hypothetical protein
MKLSGISSVLPILLRPNNSSIDGIGISMANMFVSGGLFTTPNGTDTPLRASALMSHYYSPNPRSTSINMNGGGDGGGGGGGGASKQSHQSHQSINLMASSSSSSLLFSG